MKLANVLFIEQDHGGRLIAVATLKVEGISAGLGMWGF
jgi:hypothetical protein